MHVNVLIAVMVLLGTSLSGCSQHEPSANAMDTSASADPGAPASPNAVLAAGANSCELLTDAEVRAVFPKAAAGKRNTSALQYGFDRCAWETPTGQIGIEVSHVDAEGLEAELRGELTGVIDPRIEGAVDHIRLQSVPGIGDDAIAILEKADAKRGILTDVALLAIQHGHRMAVLMAHEASPDAPLPSLDDLTGLGRQLARRL